VRVADVGGENSKKRSLARSSAAAMSAGSRSEAAMATSDSRDRPRQAIEAGDDRSIETMVPVADPKMIRGLPHIRSGGKLLQSQQGRFRPRSRASQNADQPTTIKAAPVLRVCRDSVWWLDLVRGTSCAPALERNAGDAGTNPIMPASSASRPDLEFARVVRHWVAHGNDSARFIYLIKDIIRYTMRRMMDALTTRRVVTS